MTSDTDESDEELSLADELFGPDAQVKSYFDNSPRDFWAWETIDKLVHEDAVRRELGRAGKPYDDKLVHFILEHGKRLFAVAVAISFQPLLEAMKFFQKHQFTDTHLGASVEVSDHTSDTNPRTTFQRLIDEHDPRSKLWRPRFKHKFSSDQWMALVPTLSPTVPLYHFRQEAILPFTEMTPIHQQNGAFSRVYQVRVDPAHYHDPDTSNTEETVCFALKEMVPPPGERPDQVAEKWAQEATTLQDMNGRDNGHIIRFITSFKRGSIGTGMSYYLMFEWADGGCLEDLWRRKPKPVLTKELVKEGLQQLHGLAGALSAAHYQDDDFGIRHGDIKPDNILRFEGGPGTTFGTLKIGDWGLAKYHNTATHKRINGTSTTWGTTLYEPPEFEVPVNGQTILGRQFDVWSLGCVILELLIWLLYGYDEVLRFRKMLEQRSSGPLTCYKVVDVDGKPKAEVHDVVLKWMDQMEKDPACAKDTALGELLGLVKRKLLIVDLGPFTSSTVVMKDIPPEKISSSASDKPEIEITITPTNSTDTSDLGRRLRMQQYRATTMDIRNYMKDVILDDEDRDEEFWLKALPRGFQRRPPPDLATQDASGHLTSGAPSVNIANRPTGGRSISSSMIEMAIRE
ncbi:kinase-like protein [Thozetella sp. PMI_491]|nr:kinase-like protein [Thozetella sp. PMI_491]